MYDNEKSLQADKVDDKASSDQKQPEKADDSKENEKEQEGKDGDAEEKEGQNDNDKPKENERPPEEEAPDEEAPEEEVNATEMTGSKPNTPAENSFVFLVDLRTYALVKRKIEDKDNCYECVKKKTQKDGPSVDEEPCELMLLPVKDRHLLEQEKTKEELEGATWFTNKIYLEICVILSHDKKVNLTLSMHSDDKAMQMAEQVADLFGETKYSISFFRGAAKINLNDKLADLGLGFYDNKENLEY